LHTRFSGLNGEGGESSDLAHDENVALAEMSARSPPTQLLHSRLRQRERPHVKTPPNQRRRRPHINPPNPTASLPQHRGGLASGPANGITSHTDTQPAASAQSSGTKIAGGIKLVAWVELPWRRDRPSLADAAGVFTVACASVIRAWRGSVRP
jgi:hypothetical protein